jgi:putative polyhydroxyalkanoate system protein
MSIKIERKHSFGKEVMREKLERIKEELEADLGLETAWKGDKIVFNKMGVEGYVSYDENSLLIHASKPFYVPVSEHWLKEQIESRIDHYLVEDAAE